MAKGEASNLTLPARLFSSHAGRRQTNIAACVRRSTSAGLEASPRAGQRSISLILAADVVTTSATEINLERCAAKVKLGLDRKLRCRYGTKVRRELYGCGMTVSQTNSWTQQSDDEPMMPLELPTRSPSPVPGNDKDEKPTSSSSSSFSLLPSLTVEDTRPFLRRALPSVDGGGGSSSRRRRVSSEPSLSSLSSRLSGSESFGRDVGHAAAETYLVTRLAITLLRYLGVGYRWITKFLALVCYATLLTPGFLQVGYFYFFSSQVRRSIIYGDKPRNRLDLYLPAKTDGLRPVVAFVTGGAWIIGVYVSYKAWGALLGRRLAERGIIVACIDYRNFPQGTISSMVEDVSQGISFMCNNAEAYGGDPNRIYLIGQSAGAHIASCTILNQAITECGEGESTAWSVSQIKAYFGISGGYNVVELVDHFHRRGLYQSIFLSVMEGEKSLRKFSPEILVKDSSVKHAISLMPPTILFHGTGDYSIPSTSSEKFANALHNAGAKVKLVLYDGKTHTDLFLQDPLRGGRDKLLQEIISVIYAGDEVKFLDDAETSLSRRLVPEFMLKLAGRISPF